MGEAWRGGKGCSLRSIGVGSATAPWTYAKVEYKGSTDIVPSRDLLERPTPEFAWGDGVTIPLKGIEARATDVCWHYNERRYFYYLESTDGKPIKRRYFGDELRGA